MCSRTIYLRFEKKEGEMEYIVDKKCFVFLSDPGLNIVYPCQ